MVAAAVLTLFTAYKDLQLDKPLKLHN